MKNYVLIASLFFSINEAYSQKNFSLGLGADFSFATKGLGLNDAGIGFHLQGNLFARHSLQLRIEAGLDKFIADKLLALDPNGNAYERNPAVKRILAGPEYFPHKKISVAALYGVVWNNWMNKHEAEDGFRVLLSGHLGKQRKFIPALSFTVLPGTGVQYFTLSVGAKLL
jgi:hypothetical protein